MSRKTQTGIYTLELSDNEKVEITWNFTPGDPGVHTFPNGDPGYPGTDDELEFEQAILLPGGTDVSAIFSHFDLWGNIEPAIRNTLDQE